MENRARSRSWLIVNPAFNRRGGQELANFELAHALVKAGRDVTLVAHDVDPLLVSDGAKAVCVPRPLKSAFLGERALERVAWRERSRLPGNAVFVGNSGNCPGASVSWVHFVHAAWAGDLENPKPGVRTIHRLRKLDALRRERLAMQAASVVVANSEKTKAELSGLLGVPSDKIVRIYFGASVPSKASQVPENSTARTLLFVGALGWDRRKGLDIALQALAVLVRRGALRHRLVVAGAGTAGPWRALAERLGVGTQVTFLDFVDDVTGLLTNADLLISPSRYESYGLAIQEAVCAGVPPLVLANRVGFMERLPRVQEVFSVPTEEPDVWAERIRASLERLSILREQTMTAREFILSRSWSDFAREFIAVGEDCAP